LVFAILVNGTFTCLNVQALEGSTPRSPLSQIMGLFQLYASGLLLRPGTFLSAFFLYLSPLVYLFMI